MNFHPRNFKTRQHQRKCWRLCGNHMCYQTWLWQKCPACGCCYIGTNLSGFRLCRTCSTFHRSMASAEGFTLLKKLWVWRRSPWDILGARCHGRHVSKSLWICWILQKSCPAPPWGSFITVIFSLLILASEGGYEQFLWMLILCSRRSKSRTFWNSRRAIPTRIVSFLIVSLRVIKLPVTARGHF